MQKCKVCSNNFKYKDIMKSLMIKGYAPIVCDKCNTTHHVHYSTRLIISLIISLPIIINMIGNLIYDEFLNFSLKVYLSAYITWIVIMISLIPFYARYYVKMNEQDKEKALLASNLKSVEAEIIISILKSYEIPFIKKSNETGTPEVLTGSSLYGIDIYVQPHMLQTAEELINIDNIVLEQEDIEY